MSAQTEEDFWMKSSRIFLTENLDSDQVPGVLQQRIKKENVLKKKKKKKQPLASKKFSRLFLLKLR